MRRLGDHTVLVFLPFFAVVCSILMPHAIAQEVNQQVNASVNSSSSEPTSVGSAAYVSAAANTRERIVVSGVTQAGVRPTPTGFVPSLTTFNGGKAFKSGGKSFIESASLHTAVQSKAGANQHPAKRFKARAKSRSKESASMIGIGLYVPGLRESGEYAHLGQFPDSTRGTGWPSPAAFYSPYGVGFSVRPLLWSPNFNSVDHLDLSYLVSPSEVRYLMKINKMAHKERGRQTELQRLTDALKYNNRLTKQDLLISPLGKSSGSLFTDQSQ